MKRGAPIPPLPQQHVLHSVLLRQHLHESEGVSLWSRVHVPND